MLVIQKMPMCKKKIIIMSGLLVVSVKNLFAIRGARIYDRLPNEGEK